MATDIIYGGRVSEIGDAKAEGDNVWLSKADLTKASGWELKPEGACMGDLCVPIPPVLATGFIRDDGRSFNLAALARHLGQPTVHDEKNGVWYFGEVLRHAAPASPRCRLRISSCPKFFAEARRLRPESCSFKRQTWELEQGGKAAGPEFFAEVKGLADKHYYAPLKMKGSAK